MTRQKLDMYVALLSDGECYRAIYQLQEQV